MKAVVTGAAGFIGSRISFKLLESGHTVTGIDCMTDFYPRWIKQRNLDFLTDREAFSFIEKDVVDIDSKPLLGDADCVFHLAAQAGVRSSWGKSFSDYVRFNIEATQKLLEGARDSKVRKFVYASSSSVYGLSPELPWKENGPLRPHSPYGVTKLAAENLCSLYHANYGLPTVSLRFFTVYGPGQRPDMAFHRFLKAVWEEKPIVVFGDGHQTRDFTYIDDIIEATVSSLDCGRSGEVYNIGGGHRLSLNEIIEIMSKVCRKKIEVVRNDVQKGDVPDTFADIRKAGLEMGYVPRTDIEDGLSNEWRWIQELYSR